MSVLMVKLFKQAAYLDRLNGSEPLLDLPFPDGYSGLPAAAVSAALAWLDHLGVSDSIVRRLEVYSWVLDLWPSGGTGTRIYRRLIGEYRLLLRHRGNYESGCA